MEREIVLPDRKPYQEWLLGRAVEKTGGGLKHAMTMGWLGGRLMQWAEGRGYASMSWTFRLAPRREVRRPLIPDLAYLSFERARTLTREELDMPTIAPDAAIEILAPDDVPAHLQHKIDVYLATGGSAVVFADPYAGSISVHDARGSRTPRKTSPRAVSAACRCRLQLPSSSRRPASSMTGMPRDSALTSFVPASSPATT